MGGLLVRLPLEIEVYRSAHRSIMGRSLRKALKKSEKDELLKWYPKSKGIIASQLNAISTQASKDGEIDAETLDLEAAEFLQAYIDNQVRKAKEDLLGHCWVF